MGVVCRLTGVSLLFALLIAEVLKDAKAVAPDSVTGICTLMHAQTSQQWRQTTSRVYKSRDSFVPAIIRLPMSIDLMLIHHARSVRSLTEDAVDDMERTIKQNFTS
ncbi:hypothetical protein PCE1_003960 [Barthelona sp. PCE]